MQITFFKHRVIVNSIGFNYRLFSIVSDSSNYLVKRLSKTALLGVVKLFGVTSSHLNAKATLGIDNTLIGGHF